MKPAIMAASGSPDIRYCSVCGVHLCATCRNKWTQRIVSAFVAALKGKRPDFSNVCYLCGTRSTDGVVIVSPQKRG